VRYPALSNSQLKALRLELITDSDALDATHIVLPMNNEDSAKGFP
jgi:hypothetical protein